MKLSQLAKIIKENEIESRKIVPRPELRFKSEITTNEYIDNLDYDDEPEEDVIDDSSGEIFLHAHSSKRHENWGVWGIRLKSVYGKDGLIVQGNVNIQYRSAFDAYRLKNAKVLPEQFDTVAGNFTAESLGLRSLKWAPKKVFGEFSVSNNELANDSIQYLPQEIKGDCFLTSNKFTSLHNIHKYLKRCPGVIYLHNNPIQDSILGLFMIEDLKGVEYDNDIVRASKAKNAFLIVAKHLKKGRDAMFACQQELIDAGLEEFAKL